jgi:hypothetical protein
MTVGLSMLSYARGDFLFHSISLMNAGLLLRPASAEVPMHQSYFSANLSNFGVNFLNI